MNCLNNMYNCLIFLFYFCSTHPAAMPFKCMECSFTADKSWEVKKHFNKHLRSNEKPLTCRFPECDWFGLCAAEYIYHKKTHGHCQRLKNEKETVLDEPISNPGKYLVDNKVMKEIPKEDVLKQEKAKQKINKESSKRNCTDMKPLKRTHKQAGLELVKKKNTPDEIVIDVTGKKTPEDRSSNQKQPSPQEVPATPLLDEPYEPGPVRSNLPDYHPTLTNLLSSPPMPMSSPICLGIPTEAVVPDLPFLTNEQITSSLHDLEENSTHSLVETPTAACSVNLESVGSNDNHGTEANTSIDTDINNSLLKLQQTVHQEFHKVRQDNSYHGSHLLTALKDMNSNIINHNTQLRSDIQELKPRQKSDFEIRLEIAGHGSALLNILANKHDHEQGFDRSCKKCQKGNALLFQLINITDPKIIDPFSSYFD